MADENATRKDLADLTNTMIDLHRQTIGRVEALENRVAQFERNIISLIDENFATKQEFAATEERLNEKIHDTETRLLRGFEFHARATETHLKILDGQTAANFLAQAGMGNRITELETQVREIRDKPPL